MYSFNKPTFKGDILTNGKMLFLFIKDSTRILKIHVVKFTKIKGSNVLFHEGVILNFI